MQSSSNISSVYTISRAGNVEVAQGLVRAIAVRRLAAESATTARQFFAGIETLAHEAALSNDPRVHNLAVQVIALQLVPDWRPY